MVGGSKQAIRYEKTLEKISGYVGNEFDDGGELVICIENDLTLATFNMPPELPENAGAGLLKRWEKKIDLLAVKENKMRKNVNRLYAVVWSQSSDSLRTKLEALADFETVKMARDGLRLLRLVRNVMQDYQDKIFPVVAGYKARTMVLNYRQQRHESVRDYNDAFKSMNGVLKNIGATISPMGAVVELVRLNVAANADDDATQNAAQELEIAVAFLYGADETRFKSVTDWLANQYLVGQDVYPRTLNEAYTLLTNWQQSNERSPGGTEGLVYTTTGTEEEGVANATRKDKSHITCYACNEKGHYANDCPTTKEGKSTTNTHQGEEAGGPPTVAGTQQ
jgi:hypothetical protein